IQVALLFTVTVSQPGKTCIIILPISRDVCICCICCTTLVQPAAESFEITLKGLKRFERLVHAMIPSRGTRPKVSQASTRSSCRKSCAGVEAQTQERTQRSSFL